MDYFQEVAPNRYDVSLYKNALKKESAVLYNSPK